MLDYELEGVAPLRWLGAFKDVLGRDAEAMLEEEPPGAPLAELSQPMSLHDTDSRSE